MIFDSYIKFRADLRSLQPLHRLKRLFDNVQRTYKLDGPMAEIGVYEGGSALLMATCDPANRKLYACDSFQGLQNPGEYDKLAHGEYRADFFRVERYLHDIPAIELIQGVFPDPKLHKAMYDEEFSMVHLDVDYYQSTLDCLEFFYPRMLADGIIQSDDFDDTTCPGVRKAFEEFFKDKAEDFWAMDNIVYVVKL